MADTASEFKQALLLRINEGKQPQLRWVICTAVDWDNKVMDAKGVSDDLEYYDIELGAGVFDLKPVIGATCLIGIVEGEDCDGFILSASEVEKIEIKANTLVEFNSGELGGLVKVDALVSKLNAVEQSLNSLKTVFSQWVPVPQDGGSALKTAVSTWAGQQLNTSTASDLANEKIKQ